MSGALIVAAMLLACASHPPANRPARAAANPHPEYPRLLAERSVEGHVIVGYEIDANGAVRNAIVLEAEPEHAFEDTVLETVRRWKYQPKRVAGRDVATHATSSFYFCLPEAVRFGPSRSEACQGFSSRRLQFRREIELRYAYYPFRAWEDSDSPFDLAGSWTLVDGGPPCDEGPMIVEISDDRQFVTARLSEPPDDREGPTLLRYHLLEERDGRLRVRSVDETERTREGELVAWDVVPLWPNAHCWRRSDWPDGRCIAHNERCDP